MRFFSLLFPLLFFLGVFLLILQIKENPDMYYHLKAGEVFSHQGIIHTDVFSYTAQGREWFPYEWLFEVGLYQVENHFGFGAIPYAIASLAVVSVGTFFLFIKKFFSLPTLISIGISFLYFSCTSEFYVPRPETAAFLLFLLTLVIVLVYFQKSKNYLVFLFPIVLLWTNIHSSVVLALYLTGSYGLIALYEYRVKKSNVYLSRSYALGIATLLLFLLTLLPPLGTTQYKLLFLFMVHSQEIRSIFLEWSGIQHFPFPLLFYLTIGLSISIPFFYFAKKIKKSILWILPLLIFLLLPFFARRNISYAYLVLSLMLASLASFFPLRYNKEQNIFLALIAIIISVLGISLLYIKRYTPSVYPIGAVHFIQQNHLKGHMLNELNDGGYLIYSLYPQQKVFIDLRADVYLCCELPSSQTLVINTSLSNKAYAPFFHQFANKYNLSFMIVDEIPGTLSRETDIAFPDWSLVYWDDTNEILVRKNGLNDAIIKQFGVTAATPYEGSPYKVGHMDQALAEYRRMITVADSAKSENAIGLILFKKGQVDSAKKYLQKAIMLQPDFIPPYLTLATIAIAQKEYMQAIDLYEIVEKRNATDAQAYIFEGEVYNKIYNDPQKAKQIWQEGIGNVTNPDSQQEIKNLFNSQ